MSTIEQPPPRLTDWDRFVIAQARQLAEGDISTGPAQALARETLKQLAALADRLAQEPADPWDDDCDLIQVVLTPEQAERLRESLRPWGNELHAIPSGAGDLPTYGIACTAIGLSTVCETARRYARWWQHESGEAPPVYPAVNPWRGK